MFYFMNSAAGVFLAAVGGGLLFYQASNYVLTTCGFVWSLPNVFLEHDSEKPHASSAQLCSSDIKGWGTQKFTNFHNESSLLKECGLKSLRKQGFWRGECTHGFKYNAAILE